MKLDSSLDTARIKVRKPRGRHPDKRLTAVRVRSVKAPGRYADGNGLYLFVDDSGAKRWLLRTIVHGRRRDIGLGSAQLVSLATARDEAARLRRIARGGGDPLAERRRERRSVPTFKTAAQTVHTEHSKAFRNANHKGEWISSLERYAFPVFGDRAIDTITSADILKALTPIWTAKPETARRVRQRINVVLAWAKASGLRAGDNPVEGITRVLPKTRGTTEHLAALPYSEVPAFIETVHQAQAGAATKLAFEFLILTASRTNEVVGARWSEIDRQAKTWTVPPDRIKAGREHRVPLTARCLELLDGAAAIADGGPFVFPGRSPKKPMSNMVFLMLLRRLERDDITAHGFRSSFRDWAGERTTFPREVIEAALAHVIPNKTEAAYFRSDLFALRRSLMETWTAFATTALRKVVPIRA